MANTVITDSIGKPGIPAEAGGNVVMVDILVCVTVSVTARY